MEQLDKDLQKRVWQRVQTRSEPVDVPAVMENLKPLILTAQENAVAYRHMAQSAGPRSRQRWQKLYRNTRRCLECMRGICRMKGEPVQIPNLRAEPEPVARTLQKCYHRERRLWEAWERRIGDPEHGAVYGELARQAREHCTEIMEMLGRMEG